MQKYINSVTNSVGLAIYGAKITVTTMAGLPATVYSDNGTTILPIVNTDANGMFSFYAANGDYNLAVTGNDVTPYSITDVTLFDPNDAGITISVKQFGAKGDGTTTDTTAVNAAITYANSIGGGTVWFPAGTYRVRNLSIKNNVLLKGTFGAVILKVVDGTDSPVLGNQNPLVSLDYFGLEGLILDGNAANSTKALAYSVATVTPSTYFYAKDCIFRNGLGYGLGLQATPGWGIDGEQLDTYLENCYFLDNGIGIGGGADTFDGLDIKFCRRITIVNCYAHRNADKGMNVRGNNVTILGGSCNDNLNTGYEISVNINGASDMQTFASLVGCEAGGNASHGFASIGGVSGDQNTARISLTGCRFHDNGNCGVYIPTYANGLHLLISDCSLYGNTQYGVRVNTAAGLEAFTVKISNCDISENGKSGVATSLTPLSIVNSHLCLNTDYGFTDLDDTSRSIIGSGCTLINNGLAPIGTLSGTLNKYLTLDSGAFTNESSTVASATTITLPKIPAYVVVSGTTNITSITAGRIGQEAILRFTGVLTVTDGSNLVLAGNFATSSNDILRLVCDGINWFETSRSVN